MDFNEFESAREIKAKLDKVSKSFCPIMWKHATINFSTGASKSCCHHSFRDINLDEYSSESQLHDTQENREMRKRILNGEKPVECKHCWMVEDQGHLSDRLSWSVQNWMNPFVDDLSASATESAKAPSWLELNFSPVCNLKCSYCSPIFSTKWLQEIKEHGPYPTDPGHNDLNYLPGVVKDEKYENEELIEKFWPWFDKIYDDLRLVRITGGEPFLSKNTMSLLDIISSRANKDLTLSINSNLCVPENVWNLFINKVKQIDENKKIESFYLHPSIDCWGAQAEYVRFGLDFNQFQRNLKQYLTETNGRVILTCTTNNLSITGMLKFWEYVYDLKKNFAREDRWISINTEVLVGPAWQNINILPPEYQRYVVDTIAYVEERITDDHSGFTRVELEGLKKVLNMMQVPPADSEVQKKNFFLFFTEHDKRRGTNILKQFPEMEEFWNECKVLAQENIIKKELT